MLTLEEGTHWSSSVALQLLIPEHYDVCNSNNSSSTKEYKVIFLIFFTNSKFHGIEIIDIVVVVIIVVFFLFSYILFILRSSFCFSKYVTTIEFFRSLVLSYAILSCNGITVARCCCFVTVGGVESFCCRCAVVMYQVWYILSRKLCIEIFYVSTLMSYLLNLLDK